VVAVEEPLVLLRTGVGERHELAVGAHEAVRAVVVVVAHELGVVAAVVVPRPVRSRRLHAAEDVDELVSLGGAGGIPPATAVDAGDHARLTVSVVRVVLPGPVVGLHCGDAAVEVGVDPDEVLAIRPVEALRLQIRGGSGEACDALWRERDSGHVDLTGHVGDEADVPHASRLGRAVVQDYVG
jgi:hypothetical protein